MLHSSTGYIGAFSTGSGSMTVSGHGSSWSNNDDLTVGHQGTGTLVIEEGGHVTSVDSYIGRLSGSEGTVTLSGSDSKWTNSGTLILARYINSTGTLNIGAEEGASPLQPGVLDVDEIEFGYGDGTVIFNHDSSDYEFSPSFHSFSGNAEMEIRHLSGTTTFSGNSAGFMGQTTVSSGTLRIDDGAHLGGTTTVDGGTLGGDGTLGDTTLASGGTLAPGNSIGELTVDGNLTFQSGSVYEVEVDPAGSDADHTHVTGAADLSGGTVRHVGLDGEYDPSSSYTILTANSGFGGTEFADVTSDYIFLDPSLSYDTHTVDLELTRNDTDFRDKGRSGNQKSTGGAIESLGPGNALYDAILTYTGSENGLQKAFNQLSGDTRPSTQTALTQAGQVVQNLIQNRALGRIFSNSGVGGLQQVQRTPRETQLASSRPLPGLATAERSPQGESLRHRAWAQAFGGWGRTSDDDDTAEASYRTGGLLAGLDGRIAGDWTLGGFAGYSRSDVNSDNRNAGSNVDSYHLGLYGGRAFDVGGPGRLGLSLGSSFTWHEVDAQRQVNFQGFNDKLTSDYSARSLQLFGELGYRMELEEATLEPYGGLAWLRHTTEGYDEEGGAAALESDRSTENTFYTTLGFRAGTDFEVRDTRIDLYGGLGWRHAFGDRTPSVTQRFQGGESFTVSGTPIARDAAVLEAGLGISLSETSRLSATYEGQLAPGSQDHIGRLELSIRF
ncbi:autotransporter domain-containing protein [Fodinicurvata halophila]|uniref:Autotransporter domain-containing protein n=1 Tax=Fodinicurvata halophila TaxID=1419723 RepID=A0ABV8UHR8_9PROT